MSFSLQLNLGLKLWTAKRLAGDGLAAAEDDTEFDREKMMRICKSEDVASCFMSPGIWALREALELHDLSWLRV